MASCVNVQLLNGKRAFVHFNLDDTFPVFRQKVFDEIRYLIEDPSTANHPDGAKRIFRLICFGKELDDDYFEKMKYEFPKMNCIHAVVKFV